MLASVTSGTFWFSVLTSALVASVVSGLFSLRLQKRGEAFQRNLRSEDSQQIARDRYLPIAIDVYEWIWHDYGVRFGKDVGWFGEFAPPPRLTELPQVFNALSGIAHGHPNPSVRVAAQRLEARLDACYNMPEPHDPSDRPSLDEESEWCEIARNMIELVREGSTTSREQAKKRFHRNN